MEVITEWFIKGLGLGIGIIGSVIATIAVAGFVSAVICFIGGTINYFIDRKDGKNE